ncbi:Hypothetical predicted protein [Mytilus galloprovincialis]|uniref:Reverse transcriptase/retrotransposon-derived protein RNase H-like domain-containing protein n=1 Tax=Mytilus galloprovincialis TaxID=29158 RepID=A0A8B6F7V7_MYTGA|nr:Hypothetical predicted protein [Mytilus galloprovincialis]
MDKTTVTIVVKVVEDDYKQLGFQNSLVSQQRQVERSLHYTWYYIRDLSSIGEITGRVTDTSALTNDENRFTAHIDCNSSKRQTPPPIPATLPFPPTEENVPKLQNCLLGHYKSSNFNTCVHQPLLLMEGPPLKVMIDPEATPVACHTPVPIFLHWDDDVKASLDQDVRLGVIEPIPVGEPVTWCHRMALNALAIRETHHTQSPFHQSGSVTRGKKKTVFDAWNGYYSVPIRDEDRYFTTVITPWGRYRYKTATQGYIASGDGYTRRFDEIVADVPHRTKCVDDTLLWSDDIEEKKFHSAQDTVEFAGFKITNDRVRPCKRYLPAILDFPTPKNITDVRSWFGLVNQVSYAFSMADRLNPFRQLIKNGTPFLWNYQLETLFQETKTIVSEIEEGVRIFDKSKPTCLATDWSISGLGF